MSVQYSGDKITFADGSTLASGWSGFKNRLINSDMRIDQRNAGASVSAAGSVGYSLDRWFVGYTVDSKFTVQQNAGSASLPAGFSNYLGVTSSSAYSVGSGDTFQIGQIIEGLNCADLAWGTANAATVTLSFKVYSSLTGTFGGSLRNSAANRSYPFTYTVSSANTWTTISITVAGDTSGTWLTTNGVGIRVTFGLGAGSTYSGTSGSWAGANYTTATGATSVVGTSGATFYITGVQLEKGSTATSFDYRPYGTELALCQRYFQSWGGNAAYEPIGNGAAYDANNTIINVTLPVVMRTSPSLSTTGSFGVVWNGNAINTSSSTTSLNQVSPESMSFKLSGLTGLSAGGASSIYTNNSTATRLQLSAEL